MVIHPRRLARLLVLEHCRRWRGDDGHSAALGRCQNAPRGFKTIHFWNLEIHQDRVKLRACGFLDRFTTMVGDLHGQAHLFQKFTSNQLIDRVVLNQLHRGSTIAVENRLKLTQFSS